MIFNVRQLQYALSLYFLFLTTIASSQQFWNNGLEYEATNGLPRKWSIESNGKKAIATLTDKIAQKGKKSLYVEMMESEFYLLQPVDFDSEKGSFSFQSFVKVKEKTPLKFSLLVIDRENGQAYGAKPLSFENSNWNPVKLSDQFNNAGSKKLLLALKVEGTGSFWVDNLQFSVNGKTYGEGEVDFREPDKEEIQNLNKHAHPFHSNGVYNFEALNEALEGKTIVGLGENSHGSSTIFKVKLELTKFLIKEHGFTTFALESPAVEADYINSYVLSGEGTTAKVLENLAYPSWQIEEMLSIIEWIKEYNQTAKDKVEFKGIDMQSPTLAFKKLTEFGDLKKDSEIQQLLNEIKSLYNKKEKTEAEWKELSNQSLSLGLAVFKYNELKRDIRYHYYADILYRSLLLASPATQTTRDKLLSDNIRSIQSRCDCKVIVSADNDHLRKVDGKTGYYMDLLLGDVYLNIGFTYNRGTYAAYGKEMSYPVDESYAGTYEYLLSKSKYKEYFLVLNQINNIPLLDQEQGFRVIGSRPQQNGQFFEINLKDNFDVLFYLEASKHTFQKK